MEFINELCSIFFPQRSGSADHLSTFLCDCLFSLFPFLTRSFPLLCSLGNNLKTVLTCFKLALRRYFMFRTYTVFVSPCFALIFMWILVTIKHKGTVFRHRRTASKRKDFEIVEKKFQYVVFHLFATQIVCTRTNLISSRVDHLTLVIHI